MQSLSHNGIAIIENFLPEEHFKALGKKAERFFNEGLFKQSRVGQTQNAAHHQTIRNDKILWLDQNPECNALNAYQLNIKKISKILNESFFLGLFDYEAHFAIYQPGDFYKKHVDQFRLTKERQISCVYYLNTKWHNSSGGELILYDHKSTLLSSFMPTPNRLICFKSDLPHEVRPTTQERYSITGWLKTRSINHVGVTTLL